MPERGSRIETLDYIASMLQQLRLMAQGQDLPMLAYLIDMAQIEASDTITRLSAASEVREQRNSPA
jgi:hypothetical protein